MVIVAGGSVASRFYSFELVIEKEADDEGLQCLTARACPAASATAAPSEPGRNMQDAIRQHVASLLAQGEPVPQNERLVHVEELSIGVP
jgi:hypothetical protein